MLEDCELPSICVDLSELRLVFQQKRVSITWISSIALLPNRF